MQRKFLDYNTLQYTLADPRYAVSHHSDGYSGTAIAVATCFSNRVPRHRYSGHYGGTTLVTAYRGTAIAALHYSGTAVRGGLLHRCRTGPASTSSGS